MNTPLDFLDLLLALYLLIELPRRQLWRSLRPSGLPLTPRLQRYRKNIAHIALPLVALAASMWWTGRIPADLGLDLPSSGSGLWCLVVSALALLAMHFGGVLWERSLPRTAEELRAFLLLSLFVGCGWELLYRGFLLLVLPPSWWLMLLYTALGLFGAMASYRASTQEAAPEVNTV